jgi:hypothetical protein
MWRSRICGRSADRTPLARVDERGAALFIAILVTLILGALAAGLVAVTMTETMISGAHRSTAEAVYAAEAALERAVHDLATVTDWSAVLAPSPGNLTSTFMDASAEPLAPDGRSLSVPALTASRQRASDARDGTFLPAGDWPRWQLYGSGALESLPLPAPGPPAYLLVWVADDGDGDGNPSADANGQILVHAEAYGIGARRAVEAAVRRVAPGVVQVFSRRPAR